MSASPSALEEDDRWARVGEQLRQRRAHLGYPKRTQWVRDRESSGFSARTIIAAEKAERTNFSPETLTTIEIKYELMPGTIRRMLDGQSEFLEPLPSSVGVVAVPSEWDVEVHLVDDPAVDTDQGERLTWEPVTNAGDRLYALTVINANGKRQGVAQQFSPEVPISDIVPSLRWQAGILLAAGPK